jgi:hypothetical protein
LPGEAKDLVQTCRETVKRGIRFGGINTVDQNDLAATRPYGNTAVRHHGEGSSLDDGILPFGNGMLTIG